MRPPWRSSSFSPVLQQQQGQVQPPTPTEATTISSSSSSLPRLFLVGSTVGPIVDSLHNQCLLEYHVLPINIASPVLSLSSSSSSLPPPPPPPAFIFSSSWTVPPLLGVAYIVLGVVLPRLIEKILAAGTSASTASVTSTAEFVTTDDEDYDDDNSNSTQIKQQQQQHELFQKAIVAVITTALIIKTSELLETRALEVPPLASLPSSASPPFSILSSFVPSSSSSSSFLVLIAMALVQWFVLDRTMVSLLAASVTSIGGPLSELPFVGHGVWTYLESAGDYFPLKDVGIVRDSIIPQSWWTFLFGTSDYENLALSSLTGPCYFAVCMDAIALGRYFDSLSVGAVATPDRNPEPNVNGAATEKMGSGS